MKVARSMNKERVVFLDWLRIIACFIAVIINNPWLSFVFEIVVLNLLLVYMVMRHEGICKKAIKELEVKN